MKTKLEAGEEQWILDVLRTDPWPRRTSKQVALFCGKSEGLIKKIRAKYGLTPTFVEVKGKDGKLKIVRVGLIGKKTKKLTPKQQERVDIAWADAQREARAQANGVLNEEDLLGIAKEAVMTSARYFKPEKLECEDKEKFWKVFANKQVLKEFNRAFKIARERAQVVTVLHGVEDDELPSHLDQFAGKNLDDEELSELVQSYRELTGQSKFIIRSLAGLYPLGPDTPEEIAKVLGVDVPTVMQKIERAKMALCG